MKAQFKTGGAASRWLVLATAATVACAGCAVGEADSEDGGSNYPTQDIEILAPGSTGGGWDTRARAISTALTECDVIDQNVNVTNKPGAGGTIGLADFVQHEGDPHQLMVMDTITMLGGIVGNDSAIDLTDLTPIAGMTFSPSAIVVPADSSYKDLDQLLTAQKEDPKGVAVVGGSLGGPDHILTARLAGTHKVAADQINYVPTGGGGEVLSLLLNGSAAAAISTVTELRGQLDAGKLRALAVTGDNQISGVDAPTLSKLGYGDATVESLGGLLAPPGLSDDQQQAIIDMVKATAETDCWEKTLKQNNYQPVFQSGDEFEQRISDDHDVVTTILKELNISS